MRMSVTIQLVVTVGIAVCVIASAGVLFVFLVGRIESTRSVLIDLEGQITARELGRREANSSRVALASREDALNRINNFFSIPDRPVVFIETLEGIARDTNSAIAFDIDQANSNQTIFTFRVTVEGSEQGVRTFLELIELLPYEIRVQEAVFQRMTLGDSRIVSVSGPSSPTARMNLVFTAYRIVSKIQGAE